jgi:hypothetical protein
MGYLLLLSRRLFCPALLPFNTFTTGVGCAFLEFVYHTNERDTRRSHGVRPRFSLIVGNIFP